ncbi:hypothetical protein C8Q80DRAFT_1277628 [Daedaleopsis nitida]|nr:hypothetical protein C8Q80DRAFT_1277628 [Daedaleopsis nitida]
MAHERSRVPFNTLAYLQSQNVSLSDLILEVLTFRQFNEPGSPILTDLILNGTSILSALYNHPLTTAATASWAHNLMCARYHAELEDLTDISSGWHFGAMDANPDQVRDFQIEKMAVKIFEVAPQLWGLAAELLGGRGTVPGRRGPSQDMDPDEALFWDEDDAPPAKRRSQQAALMVVKIVIVISVFMHSQNQRCNALQSIMAVFLHSCNTPEKVVKVLSRIGISISLTSIFRAIDSLSMLAADDLRALGQTLLTSYAFDNLDARLRTAIPTVDKERDGLIHLTTSALFRLDHGVQLEDLRCARLLWERSTLNLQASDPRPFSPQATMIHLYGIHRAEPASIHSLTRRGLFRTWYIKQILSEHGPRYFSETLASLSDPTPVDAIPVTKTHYLPMKALDINPATISGNIDVLYQMFAQAGVGDIRENPSVQDLSEYVTIVHGDLGTYEHVRSAMRRRSQERTPHLRLQSIVFAPGLFHLKMAAADAIWRALVTPQGARSDATSFMRLAGRLRPAESSRLVSNATFRQQHELIHDVGVLLLMDAWRVEVYRRWKYVTLEDWAKTKPSEGDINSVAEAIVRGYIEGEGQDLWRMHEQSGAARDRVKENTMRILNYLLLYEELSYAMNAGDIGRIETLLPPWIQLFRATGKHKYGNLMLRFMHALHFIYPDELRYVLTSLQDHLIELIRLAGMRYATTCL